MAKKAKSGKGEFLKGALWIAAGGFVAKLVGALYRIPLTNLIGGRGLGLYQMVYPVYCLLLTVCQCEGKCVQERRKIHLFNTIFGQ